MNVYNKDVDTMSVENYTDAGKGARCPLDIGFAPTG